LSALVVAFHIIRFPYIPNYIYFNNSVSNQDLISMPKTTLERIAEFYHITQEQAAVIVEYHNLLHNELSEFFASAGIVKRYNPRQGLAGNIADVTFGVAEAIPFSPLVTRPIAALVKGIDQYFQEKDLKLGRKFLKKLGSTNLNLFIQELCSEMIEARFDKIKDQTSLNIKKMVAQDFDKIMKAVDKLDLKTAIPHHTASLEILPSSALSPDAHVRDAKQNVTDIVKQILAEISENQHLETPSKRLKKSKTVELSKARQSLSANAQRTLTPNAKSTPKNKSRLGTFASAFQLAAIQEVSGEDDQEVVDQLKAKGLRSPTKIHITAYSMQNRQSDEETARNIRGKISRLDHELEELGDDKKAEPDFDKKKKMIDDIAEIEAFALLENYSDLYKEAKKLRQLLKSSLDLDDTRKELFRRSFTEEYSPSSTIIHRHQPILSHEQPAIIDDTMFISNVDEDEAVRVLFQSPIAARVDLSLKAAETFALPSTPKEKKDAREKLPPKEDFLGFGDSQELDETFGFGDLQELDETFGFGDSQELDETFGFPSTPAIKEKEDTAREQLQLQEDFGFGDSQELAAKNWWRQEIKQLHYDEIREKSQTKESSIKLLNGLLGSFKQLLSNLDMGKHSTYGADFRQNYSIVMNASYLDEGNIGIARKSLRQVNKDLKAKGKELARFSESVNTECASETELTDRMIYLLLNGKTKGEEAEFNNLKERFFTLQHDSELHSSSTKNRHTLNFVEANSSVGITKMLQH